MKSNPPKKSLSRPVKKTGTASAAKTRPAPKPRPVAKRDPVAKARPLPAIPPILLEGDEPSPSPVSGPGERYALGPVPPGMPEQSPELADLPEAYGTQQLLL